MTLTITCIVPTSPWYIPDSRRTHSLAGIVPSLCDGRPTMVRIRYLLFEEKAYIDLFV
jgi:hypothetical protein